MLLLPLTSLLATHPPTGVMASASSSSALSANTVAVLQALPAVHETTGVVSTRKGKGGETATTAAVAEATATPASVPPASYIPPPGEATLKKEEEEEETDKQTDRQGSQDQAAETTVAGEPENGGGDGDSMWEGRADKEDEYEEEEIDPRIEIALTKMNTASDDILRFEPELTQHKNAFADAMKQVQIDLKRMANKVGRKTIERARPYYVAVQQARAAHYATKQTAARFEQATECYKKAKAVLASVERELEAGGRITPQQQGKLNAATMSLMEAERRKNTAVDAHGRSTKAFREADSRLMALAKKIKKSILKSRPYFNTKVKHDTVLMEIRRDLLAAQKNVADAKRRYKDSLEFLEHLSREIHERREAEKAAKMAAGASNSSNDGSSSNGNSSNGDGGGGGGGSSSSSGSKSDGAQGQKSVGGGGGGSEMGGGAAALSAKISEAKQAVEAHEQEEDASEVQDLLAAGRRIEAEAMATPGDNEHVASSATGSESEDEMLGETSLKDVLANDIAGVDDIQVDTGASAATD